MNSGPNSDSKQCPKSKLSQVHSVHKLDPGCAHCAVSQAWPGRVVGPTCRVTALARRVAGLVLRVMLSHRVPSRVPPAPYHGASPGRVAPISRYNPTAKSRARDASHIAYRPAVSWAWLVVSQSLSCAPARTHSAVSWPGAPAVS